MKIGLFFGTFNPIHIGHLIIANHMVNHSDLEQVWMVVTPQNPFKQNKTLLADYHRLALVNIAVEDHPQLVAKDIEFKLPKPNYTIDTLVYLKEKHPSHTFSLIMGEDNLLTLDKWKNYEQIVANYGLYIYPRAQTHSEQLESLNSNFSLDNLLNRYPNATYCSDLPLLKLSSTYIRKAIKEQKDVRYLLTPEVLKYIDEMNFYK
ncbi:MAG: nicotinate-nucleotide adenylyltransferase [Crocinitomicaceae bacterium]|nr:nicotinate-nucleotide adenylyltransferase [Crocinitomicaceae bacterium]